MTKYIHEHEKYVLETFNKNDHLDDLLEYHNLQICWLQHERLVHLIVLVLTSLLFILSIIGLLLSNNLLILLLSILLGLLTFAYLMHYYRLENTVQRWYKISNSINYKLLKIGSNLYNAR